MRLVRDKILENGKFLLKFENGKFSNFKFENKNLENGKFLLKFYLIKSVVPFFYIYV